MKWLVIGLAIVAVVVGSILLRRKPASRRDLLETTILLSVVPQEDLGRYRLVARWTSMLVYRRYVVGVDATPEEALRLLALQVKNGEELELMHDLVTVDRLLLGLLDSDLLARVAAAHGGSQESIRRELADAGLDLEMRKIEGRDWCELPIASTWTSLRLVDRVTESYGQIEVERGRLLCPAKKLGEEIKFPPPAEAFPRWLERRSDLVEEQRQHLPMDAKAFEERRTLLQPVKPPDKLSSLQIGPFYRLYPEDHGVLYVVVAGEDCFETWKRLDEAATGYRPVVLGGEHSELVEGMSAWKQDDHSGLQAGTHSMKDPETILSEAEKVDVAALLKKGGNPSYSDLEPQSGAWPDDVVRPTDLSASKRLLDETHWPRVHIALVPTDAAWKALAYLPMLTHAGEATPSIAQAVAVSRHWEEKWGARLASVMPATLEWYVSKPPADRDSALALAVEHFTFSPEGGPEILEERAAVLQGSVWFAWWD